LHPEYFFNLQRRPAFEVVSARMAAGGLVDPVTLNGTSEFGDAQAIDTT
jgi:hypothetical protein